MRRRRRKSAFSRPSLIQGRAIMAVLAVGVVAAFVFLIHQAKINPPALQETRIELPDAFKQ